MDTSHFTVSSPGKVVPILGGEVAFLPTEPKASVPAGKKKAERDSGQGAREKTAAPKRDAAKLEITDLKQGTGAVAEPGKRVVVHYRGTLTNGKQFDSSREHGSPFEFALGGGQVIRGWDEGVQGMKVGGTRKLVIPPHLAYGSHGAGDVIPPNATLVFEVELLQVK